MHRGDIGIHMIISCDPRQYPRPLKSVGLYYSATAIFRASMWVKADSLPISYQIIKDAFQRRFLLKFPPRVTSLELLPRPAPTEIITTGHYFLSSRACSRGAGEG